MSFRKTMLFFLAVVCVSISYFYKRSKTELVTPAYTETHSEDDKSKLNAPSTEQSASQVNQGENTPTSSFAEKLRLSNGEKIKLNESNFENYVVQCFQNEPCEFGENPMDLYWNFKKADNRKANDLLISFMRRNLKNQEFANHYKDILRKMIKDFYPPTEMQFQEAAYYNYLGDLETSLSLYQDLEKKGASDTSLRQAPKLNIANTLYDLKRYKDAIPYYQEALQDYVSQKEQVAMPSQNEMIRFIEGRIEDCKTHI